MAFPHRAILLLGMEWREWDGCSAMRGDQGALVRLSWRAAGMICERADRLNRRLHISHAEPHATGVPVIHIAMGSCFRPV
jgi:hypothetical protein